MREAEPGLIMETDTRTARVAEGSESIEDSGSDEGGQESEVPRGQMVAWEQSAA